MIPGVDTNHWEGAVDSQVMASRGIKFNLAKLTDFGSATKKGFVDSQFDNTYQGHREHGIKIGGWHWLQPGVDPTVQARWYLDNWFKYKMNLPPCLDFEDANFSTPTDYLWRAQVWLDLVEKATGQVPIVYTANWFMNKFDKSKVGWLVKYPLWLAQYTVLQRPPSVPYPWTDWLIWQYTDQGDGRYYGCEGRAIDMDYAKDSFIPVESAPFRRKYIHWYSGIIPFKMR